MGVNKELAVNQHKKHSAKVIFSDGTSYRQDKYLPMLC